MVLCETMPHFASEGGEIISSSVPSLNEGQSYHDVNTGEPSVQSILDAEKDNEDGQASLGENDNKGDEDSKGAAEEPENNTDDKQNVDPTDPTNTTDPTEPTDPTDATDATDATEGTDTTTSPTDTTEGTDTTTATSPNEETTTEAVVESTTITKKEKEATISDAEETNNNESENPVISDIASISELISNDSVKLELNTATESTLFGNIEDKEEESKPIKYQEIYDGGFISPGFKVDAVERNTMRLFGADPDPLPTSYDMRTKRNDYNVKILPPVRDQSPYGTCWAHSTIGMIETSLRMKNIVQSESDPGADLSEAAVAYFTYEGLEEVTDPNKATYNIDSPGLEGGDYTCLNYDYYERKGTPRASMSFADCGGNQAAATLVASAYVGAVSEADFPHTEENISDIHTNGIGNRSKYAFNSNRYEILDVDYIDRNDRNTIKRAIMKNGSVGLNYMEHRNEDNCHEIDGEWYYLSPTHVYRISDEYEQALGSNHAVMIVGWNDNIDNSYFTYSGEIYQDCGTYIVASDSVIVNGQAGVYHLTYPKVVDTSGRKGAWLLRNSWGDDSPYMNGGYFWLSYYDVCIDDLMYSIDAVEADTYKYNYHYDTTANTTSYSFNPYNVVANTYKVSDDCNQVLEAINVAFESANVGYQVVIYTKDSEMTSPMDGEEALVQRVHHDTAGIHTVKLNKSILLKSGTYYSISIVPDSYDYYIFCDDSNRSNNSTRHYYNQVDDKQSWYYSSGSGGWVDFGTAYNVSWSGFEKNGKKYGRTFRIRGLTNEAKIITFDANGGEGEMPDQGIKVSSASYINKNTFTRAGYRFAKWIGSDGNEYDDMGSIILTDDITLTADWEPLTYTLTQDWYNETISGVNKPDITAITILMSPSASPSNVDASWEIEGSNGLIASRKGSEVFIYAPEITYSGKIDLPEDSSFLFSGRALDTTGMIPEYIFDMGKAFTHCERIENLNLLDASNVVNMHAMFWSLGRHNMYEGGAYGFDDTLLANPQSITIDVSGFDTFNVTDMSNMFDGSAISTIDVGNFNTYSLINAQGLFGECGLLQSIDLSNFGTATISNAAGMLTYCVSLTSINLDGTTFENATDMAGMFENDTALTSLDLSSFRTNNVTDMSGMFGGCTNLQTITVSSNFVTTNVTNSDNMFSDCTALAGANGTSYVDKVAIDETTAKNKTYAWIDGKNAIEGYFTGAGMVTFTFDLMGKGDNYNQSIEKGDRLTKPASPSCVNYIFEYWYEGADENTPFNFDIPISQTSASARTLKAKWREAKIVKIVAVSSPSKLNYNVGETIDLTGLRVNVIYEDNTVVDVEYGPENANKFIIMATMLNESNIVNDREFVTVKYDGSYVDGEYGYIEFDNPWSKTDIFVLRAYKINILDINAPANNFNNNVVAYAGVTVMNISGSSGSPWESTMTYKDYLKKYPPIVFYKNIGDTEASPPNREKRNIGTYLYGMDGATNGMIGYPGMKDIYITPDFMAANGTGYLDAYYRGRYFRLGMICNTNSKVSFRPRFGDFERIEVKASPSKLDYVKGEDKFDPTGLIINTVNKVKDTNGNPEYYAYKEFKYSDYADEITFDIDLDEFIQYANDQITINFRGKSCTLDLNIIAPASDYRKVEFENGYDGTKIATKSVVIGNKITAPENPTRQHYDFVKWIIKGTDTEFDFNTTINDNYVLEAVWNPHTYPVKLYQDLQHFNNDNSPWNHTRTYGQEFGLPSGNEAIGHWSIVGSTLGQWTDATTGLAISSIDGNDGREEIKIYAKWNENIYNITYNKNGGEWKAGAFNKATRSYTESLTLPTSADIEKVTAEGTYEFAGWWTQDGSTNNQWGTQVTTIPSNTNADTEVFAKWKSTVSFNANGHGTAPASVEISGSQNVLLASISDIGYTFGGWYGATTCLDGDFIGYGGQTVTFTGPKILYAKWTADVYTINYNTVLSDVTIAQNSTEKTYGENKTLDVPSKAGYDFVAWYKEYNATTKQYSGEYDGSTDIISGNGASTTIYAKWTAHQYTIHFETSGHGTAPGDKNKNYGDTYTAPAPTNIVGGYTFDGWFKEEGLINQWTGVATNADELTTENGVTKTVYARWKAKVTYNANGHGSDPESVDVILGQTTPLPSITNVAGYAFDTTNSWYEGSDVTSSVCVGAVGFNYTVAGPKILYAKWNEVTYTVTYKDYDGSALTNANWKAGFTAPTSRKYTESLALPGDGNVLKTNS